MKELEQYFKLQKQIYDYFGYVEDWAVIPLYDSTAFFWSLTGEGYGNSVQFAKSKELLINGSDEIFSNEIYTQRFLPKWVYRGQDYTMIVVDTHIDGNKFLRVFANDKEVKIG